MAPTDVDSESFAVRYRLTRADAHAIVWIGVREGLPTLVGLSVLAVVARASVFGEVGRTAAVAIPIYIAVKLLAAFRRTRRSVDADPTREITTTFSATGLRHESTTASHAIAWAGLRKIARFKAGWVFTARSGGRFFIPARAIPTEARAPIARWAAAARVRLD
ncbi:MAG TPA: hypothetical protein VKZ18_28765 [Polyangia bacterium]|nr:hypothetical protein [Polyangia bacterium]